MSSSTPILPLYWPALKDTAKKEYIKSRNLKYDQVSEAEEVFVQSRSLKKTEKISQKVFCTVRIEEEEEGKPHSKSSQPLSLQINEQADDDILTENDTQEMMEVGTRSYFFENISSAEEAQQLLDNHPGHFIIRWPDEENDYEKNCEFVISYHPKGTHCKHMRIQKKKSKWAEQEDGSSYLTFDELLEFQFNQFTPFLK